MSCAQVLAVFSLVETFPWNYYREYYHDEQARPGAGGEGDGGLSEGMHPSSSDHALPVLPEDGEEPRGLIILHACTPPSHTQVLPEDREEPAPDLGGAHETRRRML